MQKELKIYEICGFAFTIILGVLLHFTYEWSHYNSIVSAFSATNESTWEHLKLLFFPSMLYSFFEYVVIGRKYNNIVWNRFIGTAVGMGFIVGAFYIYTGIIGKNFAPVDISLFVIASVFPSLFVLKHSRHLKNRNLLGLICFLAMALLFIIFTFNPPLWLALFRNPT